jgi:3-dehydroquinate dehydratase-1
MNPIVVRGVKIGEGMPKICVPILGQTREEILKMAQEACMVPADLVEWRADWYESIFELEQVKALAEELRNVLGKMPILFTFRTSNEGGKKRVAYAQYRELLSQVAATAFVDMIDVEVFVDQKSSELIADLKEQGVIVIGSNHDFEKTPEKDEIIRRLCYMQEIGVDISKIAVMPQNKRDVLTLLSATEEMTAQYAECPIVTMSMGALGVVSRVVGETFGSAITFGAMRTASAPGQLNVEELKKILEVLHQERSM